MKISTSEKHILIELSQIEMHRLYIVRRSFGVDASYPEGSIIYKDEYEHLIVFNHVDNRIYSFTNPTWNPKIKVERYDGILNLQN